MGVVVTATVLAAVLHAGWFLFVANSGGDLAAQDAWADFAARHPGSAYNLTWYGGMHTMSYSVLSPYVMALAGVRTTMMAAGTASAALTALLLVRTRAVRNPLACSLAAVVALLCNALSGRVTFGLGLAFALGAVAAVFCGRWPRPRAPRPNRAVRGAATALLAGTATAASPVAGLFLGVVAAALFLGGRRPAAYALGLPPVLVVTGVTLLFPFSGTQPMALGTVLLPLLFGVVCLLAADRTWRTVRTASAVYAAGTLLTWLVDSQIGSNVTRLPMLFAGVLLLASLPYAASRRNRYGLLAALVVFHGWIGFKSVDDVLVTTPHTSWSRDATRPLLDELERRGAERARVEVVPARSHRESSALAPYVTLARGWNRQADLERNPIFYDGSLTAANYRAWLDRWAVRYVVLPTGTPDTGAREETALIEGGLPYLDPVWSDAHWRLFSVRDATPLAGPGATVARAAADRITLRVERPGRILLKVPHSPWLSLVDERGARLAPPEGGGSGPCLRRAAPTEDGDEWTEIQAPSAGTYRLASPYTLPPRGTPCPPHRTP
ncbi:MFS transporter [Streptomyces somaliensis]|uniref:MFS transporter n=1 Tax=Streptomyces somaliensis TaxID=78355 RepID=UPI0020CD63AC|nr:MFS transporter [Streptomyces somaliensis]MCP9944185.1 MFS transporter [Streptomyces somaliensis]